MRKLVISAVTLTFLATASTAFAAIRHTTGTVKSFDKTAMSLMLKDGSTYRLAKAFKDPGLKAGEKVRVSWETTGKEKVAESVSILK